MLEPGTADAPYVTRTSLPPSRARLAPWLLAFFLLGFIVDIGGAFGIKYLSTALVFAYVLAHAGRIRLPPSVVAVEGTLFLFAPIGFLALTVLVFRQPLVATVLQLIYASTWLLLPLLLTLDRDDVVERFTRFMYFGALLTLGLFGGLLLAFVVGRPDLVAQVNRFTYEYRLGFFGERATGPLGIFLPNVYFGWTLLLVPAAALLVGRSTRRFAVVMLAIAATLSTGALAAALMAVMILPLLGTQRGNTRLLRAGLTGVAVGALVLGGIFLSPYGALLDQVLEKFSSGSTSTSIKLGHIQSILDLLAERPIYLLAGMGVGTPFYSIGVDRVVTNVEVSHFNMVRQYGLVYALAFSGYVALVARALARTDETGRRLAAGLIALFLAAGTNPLLQSPVFFLVLVISRAYLLHLGRELAVSPSAGAAHRERTLRDWRALPVRT